MLEEGHGKVGFEARSSVQANVSVAGLNDLAILVVVPRRVLAQQDTELPELEPPLRLNQGEPNQFLAEYCLEQVLTLLLIKEQAGAHSATALRAERGSMGTPDGLALAAGDERVGDSLVGLGLFRRHLGGGEGVDGLHGMLAWLVFGFSLRSVPFQFLFCEWTTTCYP